MTNGDLIKACFNPFHIYEDEFVIRVYLTEDDFWLNEYIMTCLIGWWNSPIKEKEGE